jgi:hypothetical protein
MAAAILKPQTPTGGAGDFKYAHSGLGRKMPFRMDTE